MNSRTRLPNKQALACTTHPEWAQKFWDDLVPLKDQVAQHPLFQHMAAGTLHLACFRHALLNFYPLVSRFPSYMALNLAKAIHFEQAGVTEARNWLIQNIKVEENHLYWYRDWALGFGITEDEMNHVKPSAAMNAVNHYLWSVNHRLGLAEGIAATNLAIEWATGDWTIQVYKGIKAYTDLDHVDISNRTLAWLRAHAMYDDTHPYEAMELVKLLAQDDPDMQQSAFDAAADGLAYYRLALDDCYQIHLKHTAPT
ncbi:MAG: iron-containing redox enzyme family protein [Pseudomonadota bacterium]|nr:iron-containing redox enzyme family protein [Pseudomonadota bacterium]